MDLKLAYFALAALAASSVADAAAGTDWLVDASAYRARIAFDETSGMLSLANGLVERKIATRPAAATVSIRHCVSGEEYVRAVSPEAYVTFDGKKIPVGGLAGQPVCNFLKDEWLPRLVPTAGAYRFTGWRKNPIRARFPWKKREEWLSRPVDWPPKGEEAVLTFVSPEGNLPEVEVHYEIYDGIPTYSKWIEVENRTDRAAFLEAFVSEEVRFEDLSNLKRLGTGALNFEVLDECEWYYSRATHFVTEPDYKTQFRWQNDSPCRLEVAPRNCGAELAPGGRFASPRTWTVLYDSTERERRSLALRRTWKTIAPWTCENPLMFHQVSSDPAQLRKAIAQCRNTGFETVIVSFGSGFNLESKDPVYRAKYKAIADEAHAAGVGIGAYSLLFSRHAADRADDVVNPKVTFGCGPCLCSKYGRDYLETITSFMSEAGFDIFENDGPYPGDFCSAANHPGHRGAADSVYAQWNAQAWLYRFCRAHGIFVNMPDLYHLSGGNKICMYYREDNLSLPRELQPVIERQGLFDSTWEATQTMGYMFVPITVYHGGGAAATLQPLREHLKDYDLRLAELLGAGVQATWRGDELYDAPETLKVVKGWVDYYKRHRRVLEGDIIHLRRADGRDWDGWLTVDPSGRERAHAMLFNPTDRPLARSVRLPLHYAGVRGAAQISVDDAVPRRFVLDAADFAEVPVSIPAGGYVRLLVAACQSCGLKLGGDN